MPELNSDLMASKDAAWQSKKKQQALRDGSKLYLQWVPSKHMLNEPVNEWVRQFQGKGYQQDLLLQDATNDANWKKVCWIWQLSSSYNSKIRGGGSHLHIQLGLP